MRSWTMPAYNFDVIFTVEARSNVFLEVMTEHFRLSESRVFAEIQNSVRQLRGILDAKGVAYADLKRALVPSIDGSRSQPSDPEAQQRWRRHVLLRLSQQLAKKDGLRHRPGVHWLSALRRLR